MFTLTADRQSRLASQLVERRRVPLAQPPAAEVYAPSRRVSIELFADRIGVAPEEVAELVAAEFDLPFIDLDVSMVDPAAIALIDPAYATSQRVLPVFAHSAELTVAIADPLQKDEVRLLSSRSGLAIAPVLALRRRIEECLLHFLDAGARPGAGGPSLAAASSGHAGAKGAPGGPDAADDGSPEAEIRQALADGSKPDVVRLVEALLKRAIAAGASDIHCEPRETEVVIRYRIDGVLYRQTALSPSLARALASRIKILSQLDIAERARPQDGRFALRDGERQMEFRVSVLPTQYGEKLVLRLLDRASIAVDLGAIGLSPEHAELVERLIALPNGVLVVTGPTGSGKTTTLYAALARIATEEVNVLTVEDPIEYQLPTVSQVQVNPARDLTFATALRAALRQDPDIIMVGEMRDPETAEIALRAALTGHLVLTTLHTNDAPSALARLIDMGIDRNVLAVALSGVLAQRLARRICPNCIEAYEPPAAELRALVPEGLDLPRARFFRGRGCPECQGRGTRGRVGLFELFAVDERLRELIQTAAPLPRIRAHLAARDFLGMRFDGLCKVLAGRVTAAEVVRLTRQEEPC